MKRLFFGIILALVIMVISRTPQARVTGVCADCHTMHNSQGGKTMSVFYGDSRYTDDPLECLLVGDCVGCHTSTDGGASGIAGAPAVFSASAPDYGATIGDGKYAGLAAGNFYWVTQDDANGHNIFTDDGVLTEAPGRQTGCGSDNSCHLNLNRPWPNWGVRVGCESCHMLSDAVAGYHHADDSATVVDSDEEGWYRFLASPHWPGWGVAGIEDDDWQLTSSPSDHNEYLGNAAGNKDAYGGFLIPGNGNTMTGFCSGCHEEFHKQDTTAAGASPWIRHPSDAVIPITGEYAGYTTYNPLAPVARPSLSGWTGPSSSVNQGGTVAEDLVMCLSCHRAHASPYYKMLRWDYKSWPGGGTNGCATCHTWKQ